MSNQERFVSLAGFFAFEYPATWVQETDEAGHYLFYNPNGGSGLLRVILMKNDFEGENAAEEMMQEIIKQNKKFEPQIYIHGQNRFVHFVKENLVNGSSFTVYYWTIMYGENVLLFTFTIQTSLKELPSSTNEKDQVEAMIASVELLHNTADHGTK